MWMCPVICLNSKSFKIFLLAVLPWIPPSPILSSRPVLNVSSDKSSECFMPRNPDVGHRQNKSGSLNIKLFLTFNKSWSVELFWADLHWIGSLEPWTHKWTPPPPGIETSKGAKCQQCHTWTIYAKHPNTPTDLLSLFMGKILGLKEAVCSFLANLQLLARGGKARRAKKGQM